MFGFCLDWYIKQKVEGFGCCGKGQPKDILIFAFPLRETGWIKRVVNEQSVYIYYQS